jgi:negative regulator of replication initiation
MASAPHDHGATRTTAHFEASEQAVLRAGNACDQKTLPTFTWWNGTTASQGCSHEAQHVCRKERMKIPATLLKSTKANGSTRSSASTIGMIVFGVPTQVLTWLQ